MKVEIYFDVVCPWCFIGERRFARALEAMGADDVEVVFRPFQLDPNAAAEARPVGEYLARRFGATATSMQGRVSQMAEGEGIRIDWDRALVTNTARAHRLVRLAGLEYSSDVQRSVVEALFSAHFTEGVDVGDIEELVAIASRAGIEEIRARDWLSSDEGGTDVLAALAKARGIGVQSVPTFVFDERYAVEGAQSVETFVAAMNELRDRSAAGAGSREE